MRSVFLVVGLLVLMPLAGTLPAAVQVGVATPMRKVMIEGQRLGWPFQAEYEGWLADSYSLALARNEYEAFQVVVIPDQNLTNARVTSGPYTNWNPIVAWSEKYNGWVDGGGQLYVAGPPEVGPLPTIRLANIRDGLEDYEYLHMLKGIVALLSRCPSADPAGAG